jgi:hypothetical protein
MSPFFLQTTYGLSFLLYFSFCVLQILFATFDPPDPPVPGNDGHFCVVGVNLKLQRFELLDSLRDAKDPEAQKVFHKMVRGIKKLWKQAANSKGESFTPNSIDHFTMEYVRVPKQGTTLVSFGLITISLSLAIFFVCWHASSSLFPSLTGSFSIRRHDCGFFMLQILQSWDGQSLVIFNQADILNIRMTLLYSWLTAGDFNIDLHALLGIDAGIFLLINPSRMFFTINLLLVLKLTSFPFL